MAAFRSKHVRVLIVFLPWMINGSSIELKLLQSTFRHGDRYPLTSSTGGIFPQNPYANVSWYPDSDGGLTIVKKLVFFLWCKYFRVRALAVRGASLDGVATVALIRTTLGNGKLHSIITIGMGKRRSYELGIALRDRYGDWLGRKNPIKFVEFHGANNERALMTASLVAAGLFPPDNGSQKWNPALNWQPVPISSTLYPHNILFYGAFFCKNYLDLLEKTKLTDPAIIEYDARMKNLYGFVSSKIGAPVNNRILYYLYMELSALESVQLPLPDWAEALFLNGSLKEASIMEFKYSSWIDELKRLSGGIWLKQWLKHVDEYISAAELLSKREKSKNKKKAFFYSGHDINVAGIMNTLGIFYPHVPNYSSAINFELHADEEQRYYVKVVHRNSGAFREYPIPNCGDVLCPLDTFKKIFSKVLPMNEIEDCGPFGRYS